MMQSNRLTSIEISRRRNGPRRARSRDSASDGTRRDGVASRGYRTPPAGSPSHYSIRKRAQGVAEPQHDQGLHPIAGMRLRSANYRLYGIRIAQVAKRRMCLETQSRDA